MLEKNKPYNVDTELQGQEQIVLYGKLLQKHHRLDIQFRNREKILYNKFQDEEEDRIQQIDQKRHAIHLELIEVAKKLDKNESDIAGDLLALEKNASEYGLDAPIISPETEPEVYEASRDTLKFLALRKTDEYKALGKRARNYFFSNDTNNKKNKGELSKITEDLYNFYCDYYDFDLDKNPEQNYERGINMAIRSLMEYLNNENTDENELTFLKGGIIKAFPNKETLYEELDNMHPVLSNERVLIFGIEGNIGLNEYGEEDNDYNAPGRGCSFSKGFKEKLKGLKNLANDNKSVRPIVLGDNMAFHGSYRHYGVAVDKKKFFEIIQLIKENKDRYWVSPEKEKDLKSTIYKDSTPPKDIPEYAVIPENLSLGWLDSEIENEELGAEATEEDIRKFFKEQGSYLEGSDKLEHKEEISPNIEYWDKQIERLLSQVNIKELLNK